MRPILAENCFACHGMDSVSRAAGLRLDSREDAIDYGAIEPGEADASELITRLFEEDAELLMPPPESHKKLTEEQKKTLVRWVNEGAPYERHWAFIAPQPTTPPSIDSKWIKNPIDAFVLDRLNQESLQPAAPESPHRLFRRLSLDVTGLPPRSKDLSQFVKDYQRDDDAAVTDWIERLMERPSWGEHRARYWLDAARYADTHGMHRDNYREIWPYRDWVIRSFNANQPFSQFTVEQLAGDLLENSTLDQKIATGFQRCTMTTNEGGTIDEENLAAYAADRVQTYGWVFMGITTNCCQCHDHKFDPISAKDFYALSAYFRNTSQGGKDNDNKYGGGAYVAVPSADDRLRYDELATVVASHKQTLRSLRTEGQVMFNEWVGQVSPESIPTLEGSLAPEAHVSLSAPDQLALRVTGGKTLVTTSDSKEASSPKSTDTQAIPEVAFGDLRWKEDERFGKVVDLDDKSQIQFANTGDFGIRDAFSHSCWFRTPAPNRAAAVVAKMDTLDRHRGWDLFIANGKLAMHLLENWPNNALKVTTSESVIKKDRWHHVAVTYDGSGLPEGIQIYLDGRRQATVVEKNNLTKDANVRTATPLRLGQRSDADLLHSGSIRDFFLFGRVITDAEVFQLSWSQPIQKILRRSPDEWKLSERELVEEYFFRHVHPTYPTLLASLVDAESELTAIEQRSPICMVQDERSDQPAKTHILLRGAYDALGEEVEAAPPEALHPLPDNAPANRLGLAYWTVSEDNPLYARVTVNRFWQEVFGAGIVTTPEDFGVMGAAPSHPELLDYLALDFMKNGTDVKRLFQLILTSSTYRQSAQLTPDKLLRDRDNALLSRGPRFRMDGEVLRDTALAAGGLLSNKMYGPGTYPYQPDNLWNVVGLPGSNTRDYRQDERENLFRRSVYTFWKRMSPPPLMEAFDAPTREVCTVQRERTNTPLQALAVLNSTQYIEAARNLAQQAFSEHQRGTRKHILQAIAIPSISRELTEIETDVLLANHTQFLEYFEAHPGEAQELLSVGVSPVNVTLSATHLGAWTMVANQILNLDETLTK